MHRSGAARDPLSSVHMPSYRDAQPPGLEITSELRTWETPHKCPRCFCEIYAGEKDGYYLEACGRCGGVWVNGEEAKRALVSGSHALEELALKILGVTSRVVLQEVSALACPECGAAMQKSRVASATIDTCNMHGTWFDPHELYAAMDKLRTDPRVLAMSGGRGIEAPPPGPSHDGIVLFFEKTTLFVKGMLVAVEKKPKGP